MSQQIERKTAQYEQLLNGLQKVDPRLYDVLKLISRDVVGLLNVVDPIQATVQRMETAQSAVPLGPSLFTYAIGKLAISFLWSSDDIDVRYYELRKGATWETADFVLRTPSLTAAIAPITAGDHTYLLKTLSATLTECELESSLIVHVDAPSTPSVTTQVVDNNVLIYWTEPAADFAIDFYKIYKDGIQFAEVSGTFLAKFEIVSGDYLYGVEAVDIAGNVGPRGTSSATVRQPPDYNLLDTRVIDWSLGTKTNCYVENGKLVACVDLSEQFQVHFSSKGWASPQDQIDAVPSYARYIQENLLTGSYSEDHDYGTVLTNCIVNYNYVKEIFSGTNDVTITMKTYYKVNIGDGWTGPLTGMSQFIGSFRYLRTVMEFSAGDADSMIAVSSFEIRLDVKREVDSGYVNALAADGAGTVVNFNKTFKDIDGIECTTDSVSPITVIVDFTDAPNPTSFKVLCYDSGGRRVDQLVYWIARGIV